MLVSERIGQFFVGEDRLEYTEYGAGDAWVVLLHGQLMPRRMQQPLARALAAEGLHVVTLDLLGHGRSDRPADPLVYSMTAFAEQVVALLDHLGAAAGRRRRHLARRQRLARGRRRCAPDRVRGLILEMPVLDNALEAGLVAFGPLMFVRPLPAVHVTGLRALTRPIPRGLVPFWAGIVLDTFDQQPGRDGRRRARDLLRPGRARRPGAAARSPRRRWSSATRGPDPPRRRRRDAGRGDARTRSSCARRSILEWRVRPDRLNRAAADFALECWETRPGDHRFGS